MGVASAVFGLLVGCGNSGKAGGGTAGTGASSLFDSSSPASGGGSPSSGSGGDLGGSSTSGASTGGLGGGVTSSGGRAASSGGSTISTATTNTGGLGGSGGQGVSTPGHAFTHPGAPLTLSDLQALKANVDQGKEPWKSAYGLLTTDGKSKTTYVMAGPFANVSRSPNVNLNPWRSDMVAIWNLARMWFFTGTDTYAKKAHDILLAWATTQTSFTGTECMLDLGDYFMFLKETDSSAATPAVPLSFPSTTSITSGFSNVDIGGATPTGSATYSGGIWTVQGGGSEMWSTNDSSHFAYQAVTGDGAIMAKVESVQNTSVSARAGVMMRASLNPGAPRAWMALTNGGNLEQNMPNLTVYGGTNYGNKVLARSLSAYWLKLERIGNIITGYVSPDGTNWAATDVGRIDAPVPDTLYVGLAVCSVANGTLNTSTFSNVQITGGDDGAPIVTPTAPAALLASPGNGAVPLRWQSSFGATSYTVKRAPASGGPYSTIASGITASSYTDTKVTNGTTYFYAVTATNAAGSSDNSPEDSATPSLPPVNVASGGTANDSANSATNAGNAFDRNPATQWFYSGTSGWLQYDLGPGHAQLVNRYTVTSSNDKVPRDPKDWQLQGSDDGSTWTALDTQTNQTFAGRYQVNAYDIANPAAYRYYRLTITANNGDGSFTDLCELGVLRFAASANPDGGP